MRKRILLTKSTMFVLFAFFIIATSGFVHAAFTGKPAIYTTDYASYEEEQAAAAEFNIEVAGESFVLLKNENSALPLSREEKNISLFGNRSDNIILGGAGSGGGSVADSKSIKDSLEAVNITLNPSLVDLYSNIPSNQKELEIPVSKLNVASGTFGMYNDAAIIVISRTGSEFNDAAVYAVPGHEDLLDHYYMLDDNELETIDYVTDKFDKVIVLINSAHPIELAVLEDNDKVDSILWIGHPGGNGVMALGPVLTGEISPSGKTSDVYPAQFKNDPTWPNYKANIQDHLVVGLDEEGNEALYTNYVEPGHADNVLAPTSNGTDAIANNDWDYYSYSRVTDKDGKTVTADGPSKGARYYATLDYEEGIYMGYKWYETANAEGYFNADNRYTVAERMDATPEKYAGDLYYNRLDGVVYPFGYGLSYSDFDISIKNVRHDNSTFNDGDTLNTEYGKDITLDVEIKNVGSFSAKTVVQVYFEAPYIDGEIEKSSVTLVEFAKSKTLRPGQSQVVKITFKIQDMASFDFDDANNSGHAGYELDPGNYVIGIYEDSHTLHDSITAVVAGSVVNYDKDADTGKPIQLRFTGDLTWDGTRSDLTYYDSRRTTFVSETPMTHLSRSDFHATYPEAPTASDLRFSDDAIQILQSQVYYTSFNDLPTDPWYKDKTDIPTNWTQASQAQVANRENGLAEIQIWEMSGVAYDDPKWDTFLNQLTFDELKRLISSSSFGTVALEAIGKKASSAADGPAQFSSGTFWVSEVNIASTWNTEIAYRQGLFVGNESLLLGVPGWYGPGLNIHRNPMAGRNFEYYSQDGFHSGKIAAYVIKGATDKGVVVYMKHLFMNDQETSRYTVSTFATEQVIREIYAKPWEMAIKIGNANASMAAFNKIGLISTTAHYELFEGLMHDEWGYNHFNITDMFGWAYNPGSPGSYGARVSTGPLGTWTNTFGRNIEGSWDETKNMVVVEFDEFITDGTRWTKDDETGTTSIAINRNNPVSINYINNRDFADYETSGILVDYSETKEPGPSAAYKGATTMKDGTELYQLGDILDSPSQWFAVRQTAKRLLFGRANSNAMKNGIDVNQFDISGRDLQAVQGDSQAINISFEELEGAKYYLINDSVLPAGLTISTDGVISGTPTVAGEYDLDIRAVIAGFISKDFNFNLKVDRTFNLFDLDEVELGIEVNGSVASDEWKLGKSIGSGWTASTVNLIEHKLVGGSLAQGLSINNAGEITGTPTETGTFNFTIETTARASSWFGGDSYYSFVTDLSLEVGEELPPMIEKVKVTFDGNFTNATLLEVDIEKDTQVTPTIPYRPGFIFTGWFVDAESTDLVNFSESIDKDVTLYAGWVEVDAASDDISNLEDLIGNVETSIDNLEALLSASEDKDGELESAIDALETLLAQLNTKVDNLPEPETPETPKNTAAIIAIILGSISLIGVGFTGVMLYKRK